MSESCPLKGGKMSVEVLPDFCIQHCEALWDAAAVDQSNGDCADIPDSFGDDCAHKGGIEFSHEALQSLDGTSARRYSVVDMCASCEVEVLDTSYSFECPFNS